MVSEQLAWNVRNQREGRGKGNMNAILALVRSANKSAEDYLSKVNITNNKAIKDPDKQEAWKDQKRASMLSKAPMKAVTGRVLGAYLAVQGKEDWDRACLCIK